MKLNLPQLVLGALVATALVLHAAPTQLPNGDFETPAGASWAEGSGGGTYSFSYPATGGNPGGYGTIDNTVGDGGFGIWVSNDGVPLAIDSLSLAAGETYEFTQDMTILSGTALGGFKVDFVAGGADVGSTGEIFPALIGDGTTWETYSFIVTIPMGVDAVKIVPLWGAGSSIGYDNICVDPTPIPQPLLPNGDFEAGAVNWLEIGDGTTWSYPPTGGNPDGHGVMTNNGTGSGTWVANGGAPLSLASLGLAGGDEVVFTQDMTILSGTNIGGLRIDFLQGATFLGDSGNLFPALIGNGSTWETYSFAVPIPAATDNIKVVPLSGSGSSVGYDNVSFELPLQTVFSVSIKTGTLVGWTPTSPENFYQPQESVDDVNWTNLGPLIVGDGVTSVLDPDGAPFYRVLETTVTLVDAVLNGGFETPDSSNPSCAESWTCIGSQPPTLNAADFRNGASSMRIQVQNDETETSNMSELQQDIAAGGGSIIPGETYDFSFWAKQVSSGVSYVQQFRIQWLEEGGAILAGGTEFAGFSGGNGEWAEIAVTGLVPPEGAATAFIQIFGTTGAVAGIDAKGEVLIDDVSLVASSTGPASLEAVLNGSFGDLDPVDPFCAESWLCVGTQPPLVVFSDSRTGGTSMELIVQNGGSATPNSSETQQNIAAAGGSVTPGAIYQFSFWAKQISSGVSYVQEYQVQWRDAGGAPLGGGVALTPFSGGSGVWEQTTVSGLVAPVDAATAFIQIVASTGALAGAEGGVLVDDVSLAAANEPDILPASAAPGVELCWPTTAGKTYQLRCSSSLGSFTDFGGPITGDGGIWSATDLITPPGKFYLVDETP